MGAWEGAWWRGGASAHRLRWRGWLAFVEAQRFEREAQSRTQELWSKVNGWLEEMRLEGGAAP